MAEPGYLSWARAQIGTRETPGPANTPKIMQWAAAVGSAALGIAYGGDHVPWCGLFAARAMKEAGIAPPKIAVRASSWGSWGRAISPRVGAILVFKRDGGGHVGFYVGEDFSCYHVLGGNQGDRVSITRIEKARLVACRWPGGLEAYTKPLVLRSTGVPVSKSEA